MNVSLTPELRDLVSTKVDSGRYASASEVVREGLRLLEQRDTLLEQDLERVREKIRAGLDSLDRHEGIPGEIVFAELEARLDGR